MKIKFYLIVFLLLISITNAQEKTNPLNICKTCGSFDLSKMTFNEKISDLIAKTEVWESASVNEYNDTKFTEEINGDDVINFYTFQFANPKNKNLGKKFFTYKDQFYFNNLRILTNPAKKINAVSASVFYDGKFEDITKFTDYLITENKNLKLVKNKMEGGLLVYQWFSESKIIQFVRDSKLGTSEEVVNGKSTIVNDTYVKLTIFEGAFSKDPMKNLLERNADFVLYDDRFFIKK